MKEVSESKPEKKRPKWEFEKLLEVYKRQALSIRIGNRKKSDIRKKRK